MKTQPHKRTHSIGGRVNIITLGCSKNTVDSEVLLSQLKGNGLEVSHENYTDPADTVIINTCGFIDEAKEESVNTILDFAGQKAEGNSKK